MKFPNKKYSVIYADPPWAPNNKSIGGSKNNRGIGGAAHQYSVMSVKDICELPVKNIAADDCLLFMWWLASMPKEAIAVVEAWGFKIKTMTCFSFLKQTSTGKDFFGMGFYSRANQEQCLVARKGKSLVINHGINQNIKEVYVGHSRKPDGAYEKIEAMCGGVPRIELFARRTRPGWDGWGLQYPGNCEYLDDLDDLGSALDEESLEDL
jgi:N6-adenosine-specific RNA methylase IME4